MRLMGRKPLRECKAANCHTLTRETYCERHRRENTKPQDTERHRLYDKYKRDKKTAAFYRTAEWQAARAAAMARAYGLCQDCLAAGRLTAADMVHHVKPLREYPELALVPSNLRPLCNKCHAKYK